MAFSPYDLLALRYLYGSRAFETGNNTYIYTDATGRSVSNIVDDGGIDTLDFSAVTSAVSINLTPGAYSSVGKLATGTGALANLTLSLDSVIENAVGTAQADFLLGNAANNTFTGGGGNGATILVYTATTPLPTSTPYSSTTDSGDFIITLIATDADYQVGKIVLTIDVS